MKTLPKVRMLIPPLTLLPFTPAPARARHSAQAYGYGTTQSSPKCFQIWTAPSGASRSMFGDQVCSFMGLSWPEAPCFPPKYPLRPNFYPDFWKCKTLLWRTHHQRETTQSQNSNSIPTEMSPKLATLFPVSEVIRTGGATAGQCSSRYKVLWGLEREQRGLGSRRAELWDHTEVPAIGRDLLCHRVSLLWCDSTAQGAVTDWLCLSRDELQLPQSFHTIIPSAALIFMCLILIQLVGWEHEFLPLSYEVIKIRKQISPPNE